jgi:ligand-binding SRPBCC domain-containing protein
MPTIHLTTFIAAPAEVVFDLSRHIRIQKEMLLKYKGEAVAGTREGLVDKDETITYQGRHLFKKRLLRVKVTDMEKAQRFIDEQVMGDFKMMKHEHHFKACENGTLLIDLFHFETPFGLMGQWFNNLYLTRYLRKLLEERNNKIKEYAESGKWKKLLLV